MRIAVLGTGTVGRNIATRLVELGHTVMMGSRTADNPDAAAWALDNGDSATHGTFETAADLGDLVFNCTAGVKSLEVLAAAGDAALAGKTIVDVANPLDFSQGMPPVLAWCNDDSLAEQIQRAYPTAHVVKTLNTMNADVMVDPGLISSPHEVFLCGDDETAKKEVVGLLEAFGWPTESILDLGGITAARGMEMFLPMWIMMRGVTGTNHFNVHLAR